MDSINSSSNNSYEVESYNPSEVNLESKPSNSEESSHIINAELYIDGIEELRTPYDYIFQGRSILPLEILIEDAIANTEELSLSSGCCSRFFSCFKKKSQNLQIARMKVIKLTKTHFNNSEAFHGNLIMSWYHSVTGRNSFKLEQKIWQKIGFANEDPKRNEMQEGGVIFVILHLLYMKNKYSNTLQNFLSCCLNPNSNGSVVYASLVILKHAVQLFSNKESVRLLQSNREKPLLFLLRLQSALVASWCSAFDVSTDKSNYESILKLYKNKGQSIQQLLSTSLS